MLKQILKLSAVSIGIFSIISCAPTGVVPQNYTYSANDNVGLVALSLDCSGATHDYEPSLSYNLAHDAIVSMNTPEIKFACNGQHQIELLNLAAGDYQITSFNITDTQVGTFKDPINFKVLPHKLVYLGNFKLTVIEAKVFFANHPVAYRLSVVDKRNMDTPLIRQKLPNVPVDSYIYTIVSDPKIEQK